MLLFNFGYFYQIFSRMVVFNFLLKINFILLFSYIRKIHYKNNSLQNSCHSSFEQTDLMVYFLLVIVTSVTSVFLDWHQGDPIRSVLLVIIGWMVGWQRSFLRNGSTDFSDLFYEVRGL